MDDTVGVSFSVGRPSSASAVSASGASGAQKRARVDYAQPQPGLPAAPPVEGAAVCATCGKAAVLRTVRKEGPNTGRKFYVCPGGDDFFAWADVPSAAAPEFALAPSPAVPAGPAGLGGSSASTSGSAGLPGLAALPALPALPLGTSLPTGAILCKKCGGAGVCKTSRKGSEPRDYYTCGACNVWISWADELPRPDGMPAVASVMEVSNRTIYERAAPMARGWHETFAAVAKARGFTVAMATPFEVVQQFTTMHLSSGSYQQDDRWCYLVEPVMDFTRPGRCSTARIPLHADAPDSEGPLSAGRATHFVLCFAQPSTGGYDFGFVERRALWRFIDTRLRIVGADGLDGYHRKVAAAGSGALYALMATEDTSPHARVVAVTLQDLEGDFDRGLPNLVVDRWCFAG
jgi:ssDNA-binding Zn-finger/Zn-ribbon topoisomerase 1